ncbi:MAG: matrixin family metalloprotease [Actinomycetia bacterium]|nr:matrixin family metalloprotease [Actinomycetes bacterium]
MEERGANRTLRFVAICLGALMIVVATATPAGLLGGASADRPATEDYLSGQKQTGEAAARPPKRDGYSFLLSSDEHVYPARWCAQTTIGYTVDFSQTASVGLDQAQELLRWEQVFNKWNRASRGAYSFEYLGEKRLPTVSKNSGREIDIDQIGSGSIGITYVYGDENLSAPTDYRASAVNGRTAGNGGLQVVSRGDGPAALVGDRGFIMIDAEDALSLTPDGLRKTLYLHESGHALGLGHVDDPNSLMHGTLSESRLGVGPGDLTGINELASLPCTQ